MIVAKIQNLSATRKPQPCYKRLKRCSSLIPRPSHVFQCTWEKSGRPRPGWSGDVIRPGCESPPTCSHSWSHDDSWPCSLHGWVGGDMQPCLKPHQITLPNWQGLPDFSHIRWKTWEGLGTRLAIFINPHYRTTCTCVTAYITFKLFDDIVISLASFMIWGT